LGEASFVLRGKVMRLFLAVPLSDEARKQIASFLPRSLPGRLAPAANWHFTLRFLGDTSRPQLETLLQVLDAALWSASFPLHFASLGAFPNARRARVLWLGVDEGAAGLIALAKAIEEAARTAGFSSEDKTFVPHLTLSRMHRPLNVESLLQSSTRCSVEMQAQEVVLYRSHLESGPPRYEALRRWPL
jgi:2'-5' RNA ligase